MLTQRIIKVLVGLSLLLVVTSVLGVVAGGPGVAITPAAHACSTSSSSGGGC